jgi:hypothetical protein
MMINDLEKFVSGLTSEEIVYLLYKKHLLSMKDTSFQI